MEFIGEAHLDVAEDNYKVIPLSNDLLLLIGRHYVNIIKLGDSVLYSLQLDDSNKSNIIRYLLASNKLLHVGKDNVVKLLSPTSQGVFVLGDILSDSSVRLSFQESIYLLETLQDSDLNWGPDTEEISQRVAYQLQQRIPELQILPAKKQPWSECVLEGSYADLEPLFEDIASQPISDPTQSTTINKLLQRLRLNATHHSKHPSSSPVVSAAVSATEEIAVTGASDGTIAIWDISNGARLVNTINGPAGLSEVLLGEELISIHQSNTVVVHQIGEHALSETLFQHQLEGSVVMGASYVAATRTLVLAIDDVIGSPAKTDYYLQSASVNLEDRSLELGDRVRVEGGFVAVAATSGTNTVSITQDGFVVLFDSSSATISNSFKKPESTYRFSDITSFKGFVYAVTLGGTVLSFNLANMLQQTSAPSSPLSPAPSSPQFQNFSNNNGGEDPFGDFSSADNNNNNNNGEDPFGNFSSAQEPGAEDDFGFGDFATAAPPSNPISESNLTSSANINGTPPKKNDIDEFEFDSSFGSTPAPSIPTTEFSPKFSFDAPGAGIAGSTAAHNSSTGDFGELPRTGNSGQDSPMISASKLRQSRDFPESPYSSPSLQRKEVPALPAGNLDDFDEFTTSSPVVGQSSNSDPFSSDLNATSPPANSSQTLTETNFGDYGTHHQFGDVGSSQTGAQVDEAGNFGSHPNGLASSPTQVPNIAQSQNQGDFSDFSSSPQAGEFSAPQQNNVGDFGDFGDFSSSNLQTGDSGEFGAPKQNIIDDEFGFSTSPSTTLHASAGLPASAPTTPSLLSTQFHGSGALLPNSPSIFSQDAFADFTPPPVQLSQSGAHSPSPLRQSQLNTIDDFGDFGTAQSSPPPQRLQTPPKSPLQAHSPQRVETSPQRPQVTPTPIDTFGDLSPKNGSLDDFTEFSATPQANQGDLGDFGDFSTSTPQTGDSGEFNAPQQSNTDDFGDFSESSQPEQFGSSGLGDFGENPAEVTVPTGDFGQSAESPVPQDEGDFEDFAIATHTPVQQDTFDDFTATGHQNGNHIGDFGEKPTTTTDDFGDFGEKPTTTTDDIGDFGERPTASTNDEFGDFGESPASAPPTDDLGDFGESTGTGAADNEVAAPADDFGDFGESAVEGDNKADDFGDFGESASGEDKKAGTDDFGDFGNFENNTQGEDDFGDFGDFSAPQAPAGDDDDFGDFGDFSTPQAAAGDDDEFGSFEAPSETATPVAEPAPAPAPVVPVVPTTPSVFSLEGQELSEALATTFSSAFSSLIPPSSSTSPSHPEGLDLENSLKGTNLSPTSARHKCGRCGVLLRSVDAMSCLACGASVGSAPASAWSGVVLPPIAEIKFWDALGVSIRSMTEKSKEPTALSSSLGLLTPVVSTQSTLPSSTPATPATLTSSWDFNENPFAPTGRVTGAPATTSTSAATRTTAPTSSSVPLVPETHAIPTAQGFANAGAAGNAGNASARANAQPASSFVADFSSSSSSSSSASPFPASFSSSTATSSPSPFPSPSLTSTTSTAPGFSGPALAVDDDFFTSFPTSTPAPVTKSPSLTATSTPSAQPWTQFINRIPDLSFVIADKLTVPSH